MKFVLIPAEGCQWHEAGRLLGRVALPLSEEGEQQCDRWAEGLRALGIVTIYHGGDDLSQATARRIAKAIGATARSNERLREVDLGLWSGLTDTELKSRFGTAWRQLGEAPLSVCPPEGEPFSAAADRLGSALHKALRRNGKGPVAFVLRPLAFALARCALRGEGMSDVYELAQGGHEPIAMDADALPATAGKP